MQDIPGSPAISPRGLPQGPSSDLRSTTQGRRALSVTVSPGVSQGGTQRHGKETVAGVVSAPGVPRTPRHSAGQGFVRLPCPARCSLITDLTSHGTVAARNRLRPPAAPRPEVPLAGAVPGLPRLPGLPVPPPPGLARVPRRQARRTPALYHPAHDNHPHHRGRRPGPARPGPAPTPRPSPTIEHAARNQVDAREQKVSPHGGRHGPGSGARRRRPGGRRT